MPLYDPSCIYNASSPLVYPLCIDQATSGIFLSATYFTIAGIIIVGMALASQDIKRALMYGGFINSIIGIIMFAIGWLPDVSVLIMFLLTITGIVLVLTDTT